MSDVGPRSSGQARETVRIGGGLSESGVPVGNHFDKYGSRNPLVRGIMRGFRGALSALVARSDPDTIHEVGCGEGYWTLHWAAAGRNARGSDFSAQIIELARANARSRGVSEERFEQRDVYDLETDRDGADLVVCCEVLEHLEDPDRALEVLRRVVGRHLVLSVPREPAWSLMNMARGRYWNDLGNTPGHLNRWSRRRFLDLVGAYFTVLEVRSPLPWTMVLCEPQGAGSGRLAV